MQNGLFEVAFDAIDEVWLGREAGDNGDIAAFTPGSNEAQGVLQQFMHASRAKIRRRGARILEHLSHDRVYPLDFALHGVAQFGSGILFEHEVRESLDGNKRVPDFMGHLRRKGAYAGQTVQLSNIPLQSLGQTNVLNQDSYRGPPVHVSQWQGREPQREGRRPVALEEFGVGGRRIVSQCLLNEFVNGLRKGFRVLAGRKRGVQTKQPGRVRALQAQLLVCVENQRGQGEIILRQPNQSGREFTAVNRSLGG
jgi:hypothetical protein